MKSGILYVIATPIGNLEDVSLRTLRILKEEIEVIVCEDTRKTLKLLNKFEIKGKKLFAYFKGQEKKRLFYIINLLKKGKNVALVSESGTPCIHDPGTLLVRKCHEEGIKVVPVPGPSALTAALSVSGLDGDNFIFLGFPPKSKKKRESLWEDLKNEKKTVILYISPYKLSEILEELRNNLGEERKYFLIREITKKFEEYKYGKIDEIIEWAKNKKGEFTLLIEGKK